MPKDVVISGFIGSGPTNRSLVVPIVIDGKLRGHVEIAYNLENIRAQLADNFRRRLFALLGVFALGLAVMLVLTRNATRPLDELADGAAQVAEGRLDVTVPVDRDDEIGRLASTFNHMTERLRERQELEVRLAGAEKRAEIGHLASGLAHEIKNPLNALSLGLDVLRRRHRPADEAAAGEYAARIEALREEINRLAALINNFLAYGRPLTLSLAPTDVGSIVHHTLADLAETAAQAHVTIDEHLPASSPTLSGGREPPEVRGLEPRAERHSVHGEERREPHGEPLRREPARGDRPAPRSLLRGRRAGHPGGRPPAPLRSLFLEEGRRRGARPRDGQAHRRGARRKGDREEQGGRPHGSDLPHLAARGRLRGNLHP